MDSLLCQTEVGNVTFCKWQSTYSFVDLASVTQVKANNVRCWKIILMWIFILWYNARFLMVIMKSRSWCDNFLPLLFLFSSKAESLFWRNSSTLNDLLVIGASMVVLSTPNGLAYCWFCSHIIQFSSYEQKQIPQTFHFSELGLRTMSIY